MTHSSPSSLPRRGLLGGAGIALGAVVAPPATSRFSPAAAQAQGNAEPSPRPMDDTFRRRALEVRLSCARDAAAIAAPPHPSNGDEERYANKIGTDTRGLPHNERGEVDMAAWRLAEAAHASGEPADFEKIPLGGPRKLINPLGTLAVSLSGLNATQIGIPPAPALASAARAAEAAEVYWMALLRDVPLSEFRDGTDQRDLRAAAEELGQLPDFNGPTMEGRVTPATLFRGNVLYPDSSDASGRAGRSVVPPGVLDGPMLSQFLYRDVPYGAQWISALMRTSLPASEFMTEPEEWLRIQNGETPRRRVQYDATPRFLATGRDLATYAHVSPLLSWGASQLLAMPSYEPDMRYGGLYPLAQPVLNPSNPYRRSRTQTGAGGTFGLAYIQAMLAEGISRAIRAAYWQKWFVHRTLRPEAYGGLAHQRLAAGVSDYPLHEAFLRSQALERTRAKQGTYLLSQVYPEGSPMHSAYPGGAAAVGGVTVTLLKAFFDESRVMANPVQPDARDPTRLVPYAGPELTVGGELNKLALNYSMGRCWAGIHWRSDATASLAIGETIAISLLRDERTTYRESFDGFSFTRFDGTRVTI